MDMDACIAAYTEMSDKIFQKKHHRVNARNGQIQGRFDSAELERAIKEIIAEQLAEAMKAQGITKSAMAERMRTSRRQLDRLLDPATPSVTLETLRRAASAVGRILRVELT